MKKNKKHLSLILSTVAAAIIAANSHAQSSDLFDSLPIVSTKNNNAPFHVVLSDGQTHTIRLDALSQDEADAAQKRAASFSPVKPSPTYTATSTIPNINKFYGANKLPPLNQKDFGTCVTFSSSAALSYLTSGSTINVSP